MVYKGLVEQLKRKGLTNGSSIGQHSGLYEEAAAAITELLDRAENAEKKLTEYEPVVHARWEFVRLHGGDNIYCCSRCSRKVQGVIEFGKTEAEWLAENYPYCHCGAKMDEEVQE